ncbi:hypothetical protein ACEWY4_010815 [Coilia grayii]|uniref:Uncharacterized protein n=1 Tax=Coilia grayii TaxID=363190 RepID=A0ABD1K2Z0_9TELE
MASSALPEEELLCPVCYDIFRDPVILPCSHSFCKDCLLKSWTDKDRNECPVCRGISLGVSYPCNLVLKNLCEAFVTERRRMEAEGADVMCRLHNEKLKVFCLEDKKPICVVCRDSNAHSKHSCRPIDEAGHDLKEEMKSYLAPIKEKLKVFKEVKLVCEETAKYLKAQAATTEKLIRSEFVMLHAFLQSEEAARLAALREEEKEKSQMMKTKIDELNREISFLTASIRATEKQIHARDVTFLQNYKATKKRTQCSLQTPQTVPGALINVAKHIGNMRFKVWAKMQSLVQHTPVILDPCSSHCSLAFPGDLTSVTLCGKTQQLPDNPERFSFYPFVLGSEGFASGKHSWVVEVGTCPEWVLGVCTESAQRKGGGFLLSGVWRLWYSNGQLRTDSAGQRYSPLKVKTKPHSIRLDLDWDKGTLSFFDTVKNTHLYTFSHRFSERLYPVFGTGSERHWLKIAPLKVTYSLY